MHFLQLIRWKNLALIALTQLFVFLFLNEQDCFYFELSFRFFCVVISTLLLAAAGYLINDYSDVGIDVINKPDKLIVGKYITPRLTLILHLAFNFIGIALGALVSLKLGVLEVAIAFTLWQYSVRLKYIFLFGNIVVALLMALTIMVLGFAARYMLVVWLSFYTFFAFLMGLIREIVKDVEDMEGDARYNAKTLPNVLGFFKTKVVLYYLTLFAISLLIFSCVYMFYQHYYILGLYLVIFTLVPLGYFFRLLIQADSKKDFNALSALNKLIMLAGVVSMIFRCAA